VWGGEERTKLDIDILGLPIFEGHLKVLLVTRKAIGTLLHHSPAAHDPLDLVSPVTTRACNRIPWLQNIFMDGQRA
jgi:hypothetical protein